MRSSIFFLIITFFGTSFPGFLCCGSGIPQFGTGRNLRLGDIRIADSCPRAGQVVQHGIRTATSCAFHTHPNAHILMNWGRVATQQTIHALSRGRAPENWEQYGQVLRALEIKRGRLAEKQARGEGGQYSLDEMNQWIHLLRYVEAGARTNVLTQDSLRGEWRGLATEIDRGCQIGNIAHCHFPSLQAAFSTALPSSSRPAANAPATGSGLPVPRVTPFVPQPAPAVAPPPPGVPQPGVMQPPGASQPGVAQPVAFGGATAATGTVTPAPPPARRILPPPQQLSAIQTIIQYVPAAYTTSEHKIRNWVITILVAFLVIDGIANQKSSFTYRGGALVGSVCTRIFRWATGKNKPRPATDEVSNEELLALGGELLEGLPEMPEIEE